MTKPSDVHVDNSDPMLGPEQITAVADFAEQGWNFRKGTSTARGLLPADEKFNGLHWFDTDTGILNRYDGTNWARVIRFTFGYYAGGTTEAGTVTVSHGLPTQPVAVTIGDTNIGGGNATRLIKVSARSVTQIQFLVLNGGSPLPGNPVEFMWIAAY